MARAAYAVELCPPRLRGLERPEYGGSLFFNLEEGRAGCPTCGWTGVPTITGGDVARVTPTGRCMGSGRPGIASTWCPVCQRPADVEKRRQRAGGKRKHAKRRRR